MTAPYLGWLLVGWAATCICFPALRKGRSLLATPFVFFVIMIVATWNNTPATTGTEARLDLLGNVVVTAVFIAVYLLSALVWMVSGFIRRVPTKTKEIS